jgi:hypothetical protein
MKTFVVKILTSEGLEHHQLIADEDDVTILMEVMKKIERRANKLKAEVQEEAKVFSSNAVLAVTSDSIENKKESEVALLHSDSEAYYIEDCPCEWCAEIRRGKQSNNDR